MNETHSFITTPATSLRILAAIDGLRSKSFSLEIRTELVQESLQRGWSTSFVNEVQALHEP